MIDTLTVLALLEESSSDHTGAVLHAAAEELAALRALQAAAVELATDVLDYETVQTAGVPALRQAAAEVLRLAEGR